MLQRAINHTEFMQIMGNYMDRCEITKKKVKRKEKEKEIEIIKGSKLIFRLF